MINKRPIHAPEKDDIQEIFLGHHRTAICKWIWGLHLPVLAIMFRSVNKALYTAAFVADGWAGAENLRKWLYDGRTDGPTDRLMDGPTDGPMDQKVAYRVACPRLKCKKGIQNNFVTNQPTNR